MDLYDKNLDLIRNAASELYSTLSNDKSKFDLNVIPVNGQKNLIVENDTIRCYLHSIYDVQRETEEMFKGIDRDVKILIVYGLGCGHSMDYIKSNFLKLERLIVIEPDSYLFKNILKVVDLQEVFKNIQVTFAINKTSDDALQMILSAIEDAFDISIVMVYNISYRTLFKDYYENLHAQVITHIRNALVNLGTKEFFKYKWNINTIRNLKHTQYMLTDFNSKYKGKTAIMVAAGPSLNKNIELLKSVKGKAVIVPVGTAIKILHNNGITPDLRFAFDGSLAENDIFKDIDTEVCPLVYTDKLYFEILNNYKGPKIKFVGEMDFLDKYINDSVNVEYVTIKAGFSIANLAANALVYMGFEKIIFIGQDLSYTGGKLFADGFSDDNKILDLSIMGTFETVDIYGYKVYTDRQFSGMKQYFEGLISTHKTVKFINATEGGLNIVGAENTTLENVINNELDESYDFKQIFNNIIKNVDDKNHSEKMQEAMVKVEETVELINNINNDRLKFMKKFRKALNKGINNGRLFNEIEYIEKFESKLNEIEFYRSVILDSLRNPYRTLEVTFGYKGEDKVKRLEAFDKMTMGKTMELSIFLSVLKDLIEEFKTNKEILK